MHAAPHSGMARGPSVEPIHLDDMCWRILKTLSHTPKTPQMVSRIHGIPIAECWNRIRFLEGLDIIQVVLTFVTSEGKVLSFYQTMPEKLSIIYEDRPAVYFTPAG